MTLLIQRSGKWLAEHFKVVVFVSLLALIAVVYANSIKTPFYYDDYKFIVGNSGISEVSNLKYIFNRQKYFELFGELTYRPVEAVVFVSLKAIFGYQPSYWRIANLILHFFNCYLLFLVLRRFRISEELSLLAVSLFAVHTVNTILINMVSSINTILGSLFCLIAFFWYFKQGFGWRIASAFMFLLACFVKETYIVLPVMLFFFSWREEQESFNFKDFLLSQIGFIIAACFFLLINFVIMKNPDPKSAPYPGGSVFTALMTFSVVLMYYLKIIFIPLGLTPVYDFPVFTSLLDWQVAASILALGVIAAIIIFGLLRRKAYAPWLIWFFLFLLPTSNIIPFWAILNEWYLYLPLMGFIPGVLLLGKAVLEKTSLAWEKPARLGGVVFLIYLSALTIQRNMVWQNPLTLWQSAIKENRSSFKQRNEMGLIYFKNKEYSKAIEQYKLVAIEVPGYPKTFYNLGLTYLNMNDYQRAREYFEKAVERKENYVTIDYYFTALMNLGTVCFELKDYEAAYRYWTLAKQIQPNHRKLLFNLILANEKLDLKAGR